MSQHNQEFSLILNQRVKIQRRSDYTSTDLGQRRPTTWETVESSLPVYFYAEKQKYPRQGAGDKSAADFIMMAMPEADVQPGDLVFPLVAIAGMTMGEVLNVMAYPDFAGLTHHVDVSVKKL